MTDLESRASEDKYIEEYHARLARIRKAETEGVSAVGIFWIFPEMKLWDVSGPYTEGFENGDYIIWTDKHESHWKSMKRGIQKFNGDLNEFAYEYDHFPRGRVAYCKQTKKFIIYGPEIVINNVTTMELIKSTFHITDQACDAVIFPSYEDYSVK